jgi:hypothetical protein
MGYANDHSYTDGQELNCALCGETLQVKLHRPGDVVIATPGSLGNRVLICDDCGRVFCQSCTVNLGKPIPKCDSCGGDITIPCA